MEGDTEPLKVENHCAWTKLASMDAAGPMPIQSNEHASSSLWLKAQAEEQQKLQKEQRKDSQSFADDIAQQVCQHSLGDSIAHTYMSRNKRRWKHA